jgi:hypothetical protein
MEYLPENYRGEIPNPKDPRDIVLGDIPFVPDPNAPSWEQGFDNEIKYGKLKREHQGSSSSCVGQGWSKYVEMLNLIRNQEVIDLSARDIYSQIYLPEGGAFIREGAKTVVNKGDAEESMVSSYDNGKPPTEAFMRLRGDIGPDDIQNALKYDGLRFVSMTVSAPLSDYDWENIRQVIWQFGGFVSGYSYHCMYASAYGIKNGKKFVNFVNSYGEGSDQIYYGEQSLYDITFIVKLADPPQKINMLSLYGNNQTKEQYVKDDFGTLHRIANLETLNDLHDGLIINKDGVVWLDPNQLSVYQIGNVWLSYNDN